MSKRMRMVRAGRSAFTLIELLLVLVILAVLAGVVVPKLVGRGEDAKKKAALASATTIKKQVYQFEVDNQRFPTDLTELVQQPANCPGWKPLLEQKDIQADPFGNPWVYELKDGNPPTFEVYSAGPDGRPHTDDDIKP